MLPPTFVFGRAFDPGARRRDVEATGYRGDERAEPALELMKISRPREQIAEERGLIT
jgi:hypothetical protein